VAERRYRRFDPDRPLRPIRTSSRAAARAWLRGRPEQRVIRLQMEALGLAKRAKLDVAAFAKVSASRSRILRELEALRAKDPELAAQFIAENREKVIALKKIRLRLKALGDGPKGIEMQNRFSYVAVAIAGRAKGTRIEGLAAMFMLCASRVAGVRDPRPTEAAAMGVAAGLDTPKEIADAQAKLEDAWMKRLRLAQGRVEKALAAGEKLLAEVGIPD
jgi:hypothetical protein